MKAQLRELPNLTWQNDPEIDRLLLDLNDILPILSAQLGPPQETYDWRKEALISLEKFSLQIPALDIWIQEAPEELDQFIKSALFLYWFETLYNKDNDPTHLGSVIAESFLYSPQKKIFLFSSLTYEILEQRFEYWNLLNQSQKSNHEITNWLKLYLKIFLNLLQSNFEKLSLINFKNDYLRLVHIDLNSRQLLLMTKYLDLHHKNSTLKLTNDLAVSICGCSRETAKRDLALLVKKNILQKTGNGRSVSYSPGSVS